MANIKKIEKQLRLNNYSIAIDIIEDEIQKEPNNELLYFFLGKSFLALNESQKSFDYIKKAVDFNPYGSYKDEVFSILLNDIAISGKVITNRPKILLDMGENYGVHMRALFPIADCMTLDTFNPNISPDFYLVPNWLSPNHPMIENLDESPYKVVSMIVDRIIYAEEHIKGNLIAADIILSMEDYAIDLYKKLGFENIIYVPGAGSIGYDPLIYPPEKLEKIYDVIFLGNINSPLIYKQRNQILKTLDSLKYKYNIAIQMTPSYEEYMRMTNQAKIVLDATIDTNALNYRMFQAMGVGTLCFAEDDNSMVTELYEDKEDLVLYNCDNLDELIEYYINNEEERLRIAKNGQKKTIEKYTHYHFMKMAIDAIMDYKLEDSQKKKFSNQTISMYRGIVKHYKNKHDKALETFNSLEENKIEKINNILVEKIYLYEKNTDKTLKLEIKKIFQRFKDKIFISFNYLTYLFYIEQDYSLSIKLTNKVLKLIEDKYNNQEDCGLFYIPKSEVRLHEYFKYRHGKVIFDFNFDTFEYYQGYLDILKEQCYRILGFIYKESDKEKSLENFEKCIKLNSEHVFDYFESSKLAKELDIIDKYSEYKEYCQNILPFEPSFKEI